jgi:hypothetical protein
VPGTTQERDVIGAAGRQVTSAVRDTVEQVTSKAEAKLDEVEEKVGSPA